MKQKTLKIFIYILGFVSLCMFVAIRVPAFFNLLAKDKVVPEYWENTKYGELYNFNRISHFKEVLPPATIKYRFTKKHPDLNEADIITFGDSFFDFSRIPTFPERLGDTLHKRVFYARYDYPLNTLAEKNYRKGSPRVLIYETAERYIPLRFSKPQENEYKPDTRSDLRKRFALLWHGAFIKDSEVRYSLLLTRSYFTEKIYSMIATLKFDAFGYIAETTPVYALNQKVPWLFYYEEVNKDNTSFYYKHSDKEIETYCDNIADLRKKLKDRYNLDMLFFPMPCKYTIYHKFINQDPYNNLLPRIYKGLEKRGVPVIKVYDDYMQSGEILYFGTDTHWNEKGVNIALSKTLDFLKKCEPGFIALDSVNKPNTLN
jgi:hypothetical protein